MSLTFDLVNFSCLALGRAKLETQRQEGGLGSVRDTAQVKSPPGTTFRAASPLEAKCENIVEHLTCGLVSCENVQPHELYSSLFQRTQQSPEPAGPLLQVMLEVSC